MTAEITTLRQRAQVQVGNQIPFIDPGTITDDRCGEGQEGLMDERVSVPTGAESSELMQPTQRAFDEPAHRFQSGFASSPMGNRGFDAEPTQQLS